jgi:hypothetical protein
VDVGSAPLEWCYDRRLPLTRRFIRDHVVSPSKPNEVPTPPMKHEHTACAQCRVGSLLMHLVHTVTSAVKS